jgi:hypothetical protein
LDKLTSLLTVGNHIRDFLLSREVLGAIIGAILAIIGTVIIERRKARRAFGESYRIKVTGLLNEIANCLDGMIASFARSEIPHSRGREFNVLQRNLSYVPEIFLPQGVHQKFATLADLAYHAGKLDELLYEMPDINQLKDDKRQDFEQWKLEAARLSGDLRAAAVTTAAQQGKNEGRRSRRWFSASAWRRQTELKASNTMAFEEWTARISGRTIRSYIPGLTNDQFENILLVELAQDAGNRRRYADSLWWLVVFWLSGMLYFLGWTAFYTLVA